jgi:hypothetical protein
MAPDWQDGSRCRKMNEASSRRNAIVVISGLPRSGTSLMMSMLEAGGLELLTDGVRTADPDNPNGYFEFERVKGLESGDYAWLADAEGKAVKIISALLEHLPPTREYDVVFMNRRLAEVVASQDKMLTRRGQPSNPEERDRIAELLQKHLLKVHGWLSAQPNIRALDVNYNELLEDPAPQIEQVSRFLGGGLNLERMAGVVRPDLYRNRA